MVYDGFSDIRASVKDGVGYLVLANSRKNAVNVKLRTECIACLERMAVDPDVRCVVLSADGPVFCAGIDLQEMAMPLATQGLDAARRGMVLGAFVRDFQSFVTAFERFPRPVIAAVQGPCIGGGVDIITACDIRLCSKQAVFSVREARVGLAADVGTLQRLPRVVGCESWVRDLAYTGRDVDAEEARRHGLVQEVLDGGKELMAKAEALAREIAANSPVAVAATKASLVFSRDHTVADGLEHVATMNQAFLQAPDLAISVQAMRSRERPQYPSLPPPAKL